MTPTTKPPSPAVELQQAANTLRTMARLTVEEMSAGAYWGHDPDRWADGLRNACGGHAGNLAALMSPKAAVALAAQWERLIGNHDRSSHTSSDRTWCGYCNDEPWPCWDIAAALEVARAVMANIAAGERVS